MNSRDKIRNIFLYLLSIKNMDKKITRDLSKYIKVIPETELHNKKGCLVGKKDEEIWLKVTKDGEDLYNTLFKIYTQLEKNSEDLELIWAQGILSFKINEEKILHPIFTTKMSLNFNPQEASFTLIPYNNITSTEIGILEGLDLPNFNKILDINLRLKEKTIDPSNINALESFMEEILNSLDANSSKNNIHKELVCPSDISVNSIPCFYNAPCIILRNIDTRLWDLELKDILEYIDAGKPIPKTLEALVKEVSPLDLNRDLREWEAIGRDNLFPLPANEEQEEIVKRLSKNFGVVVQGPPGTGKSHTIANLICHLMAHGKRVLVTSQTDKALKVLSEKIPEDIKSLCISLLGNDARALKELDESVRKITEKLSLEPSILVREVDSLEEDLKKCKININNLIQELKEGESLENKTVNYKNETFTLTDLAKWIRQNEDTCNFIDDDIQLKTRCPLTGEEFNLLINLIKENKKEHIDKLNLVKDLLYNLPSYEEITKMLERLKYLENNLSSYRKSVENWEVKIDDEKKEQLMELVKKGKDKIEDIHSSWLKSIMKSYYSNDASKDFWKDTLLNLNNSVKQISCLKGIVNSHHIMYPSNLDINKLQSDFEFVKNQIESKGKITSMFKLFHGNYKYILESCEVDYRPIGTKEQCDIFKKALEKELLERNLKNLWNNTVKEYGGKVINHGDSNLLNIILDSTSQIETIIKWEEEYQKPILSLLSESKLPIELNLYKKEIFNYMEKGLYSLKYIKEYDELLKYVDDIRKLFLKNSYLSDAADWIACYDKVNLRKLYDELWKLKELSSNGEKINRLFKSLKEICPLFTEKLLKQWQKGEINSNYKYWDDAWKWKAGTSLLKEVYKVKPEAIEKDIEAEKLREKILIKEIVAKKTWYNQITRTSEAQKRSLFTWMESIKRIGKGTGKQAYKYRRLAQKEMENCKDVIPVWIMPLNKVIQNIKLTKDLFDVVIVDESSQSDISAITALLRGKRAVIVGDECQISPEAIGKNNEMVENLIHTYLKDIPHAEWFDLKTSLYHTALRVFPNRLVLKEHFRCDSDIISFSNSLCYSKEIIPLRCPDSKEGFHPAVCAVKVEDGFKDSSKNINEKEAEVVVEKIIECCNNPKYKNMTIGVISLLGENQSELIENILKEKLGIEEMIKRKIICGDAYSFQGDERDIMFLSLVIANNAKFTALTKESDIRRFNVAASRARNQMFLFHSVNLEDLNPNCVRASLLSYCKDVENKSLQYLKSSDILVSGFKNDLYNSLKAKGLNVKTDVRIGKYKIDFVVEENNKRIAVDCCESSNAFKNSWEEHLKRRSILQRVGWKFFIVRESQFYYNNEEVTTNLYNSLIHS